MYLQVSLGSWDNQVQKDRRDKRAALVRTASPSTPSFPPSLSVDIYEVPAVCQAILGVGETSVIKTEKLLLAF